MPRRMVAHDEQRHLVIRTHAMKLQHALKMRVKPRVVEDRAEPRTIKAGFGRGCRAYLNRMYQLQIEFGLYESELTPIFRKHVRGVVYDIGADHGLHSLAFARHADRVIAFEPEPIKLDQLLRNLQLNEELAKRIELVRERLGDGGLALDLPRPDFVKVDVDGEELEVLAGLRSLLSQGEQPVVVIETHSQRLEDSCIAVMQGLGYSTRVVKNSWWRTFYPEYRLIHFNRWLLCTPTARRSGGASA